MFFVVLFISVSVEKKNIINIKSNIIFGLFVNSESIFYVLFCLWSLRLLHSTLAVHYLKMTHLIIDNAVNNRGLLLTDYPSVHHKWWLKGNRVNIYSCSFNSITIMFSKKCPRYPQ